MLDKKAESGFMGSMIAVMAVVTVLMVFLASLPSAFEKYEEEDIPLYFLDDVSINNGVISSKKNASEFVTKENYHALKVIVRPIGYDTEYILSEGTPVTDNITVRTGTFVLNVDDRRVNAEYEAVVWK